MIPIAVLDVMSISATAAFEVNAMTKNKKTKKMKSINFSIIIYENKTALPRPVFSDKKKPSGLHLCVPEEKHYNIALLRLKLSIVEMKYRSSNK